MTQSFAALPHRRVLQYHNITPPHFFAAYEPGVFKITALGRRDLASLADNTDLALGDSEFNRRDLEALGFRRSGVFPIALDLDRIASAPPHPVLDRMLNDGLTNFLFVGRIVPNKRVEDSKTTNAAATTPSRIAQFDQPVRQPHVLRSQRAMEVGADHVPPPRPGSPRGRLLPCPAGRGRGAPPGA